MVQVVHDEYHVKLADTVKSHILKSAQSMQSAVECKASYVLSRETKFGMFHPERDKVDFRVWIPLHTLSLYTPLALNPKL